MLGDLIEMTMLIVMLNEKRGLFAIHVVMDHTQKIVSTTWCF